MSTMKQVCDLCNMSYETLRFYCDEGLIPNVKRDKNNYRMFEEHHIAWIKGLQCLRKCGMSIHDMKIYMNLCEEGISTITRRKEMLNEVRKSLCKKQEDIMQSIQYIDNKQQYYDDIVDKRIPYTSIFSQDK